MQAAAELVVLAQRGDQAAFGSLYEQCAPLVYRFVRRRLDGDDEIVQDLTEDVFVKAYEKLDRYVERGLPFTAWLYRIAHNHLVDYLRTLPRLCASSLDAVAEVPERAASAAFSRVLDQQSLEPALARLTPEQRQAVELRFIEGMSVAETAETMGRSDEAVKKLQARALANLRRHLAPPAAAPTGSPLGRRTGNALRMAVA
ncbi:MAG TPA: sigma-70 family RNA polymerase sigma factor [Candidatus Polarisedimenticolia bacterium]|nr:sigma-70 family RNA polymerase sigma factor [Candidatus Polarisedimenticolia bacterium]